MDTSKPQRTRFIIGGIVLISGFLSPLLIPVVLDSDWPASLKSVLTGLLAFGIPELFMILAVAIMGKKGYQHLKGRASTWIMRLSPDQVSYRRYRFGVVLFSIPLILGFLQPYLGVIIPFFNRIPLTVTIGLDFILLLSLFVLGGEFWEKLKGLFQPDVVATKRI